MSSLEHSGPQRQATQNFPLMTRLLLWAGAVGPLLFVAVLLIEGATRPGYSAWHTFGSLLAPLANPTGHGIIHALSGLAIFIVVPIAAFVMSRRFASDPTWRGWALYSLLTGLIMLVSFFLSFLPGTSALAGLLQRVGIIAGWVWVSLFAIALLRRGRAPEVTASSISR